MRLALRLGRADVNELEVSLSEEQIAEWLALGLLDDWSGWQKVGQICAAVHNSMMRIIAAEGHKVDKSDFRVAADYMPKLGEQKQKIEQPATTGFWALKNALQL